MINSTDINYNIINNRKEFIHCTPEAKTWVSEIFVVLIPYFGFRNFSSKSLFLISDFGIWGCLDFGFPVWKLGRLGSINSVEVNTQRINIF